MKAIFCLQVLLRSLQNKSLHSSESIISPWLKPYRIVQDEERILRGREFSLNIGLSRFISLHVLSHNSR